jgi:TRAP-type C4-dicarboxylate transport system permease small subunit
MSTLGKIAGYVFGVIMIALSLLITIETLIRKFFSISLGGVDELSGYAIAIGAPLAFAVASLEQSHIRINLLYIKLPQFTQAILNAAATFSIGALAVFFLVFTIGTVEDTISYKSIAQTPWATPLVYPQIVWLVASVVFAIVAVLLAARAAWLLLQGDTRTLARTFGPERIEDELESELEDLKQR